MNERKKALVTGGATGIGRSAVLALARAGYDVAINYATSAQAAQQVAAEAEALGAKTLLLQCDVSDEAAVRAMLQQVEGAFGHLDGLINNAGTTARWKVKDLESLDMAEWDRTFAVNVRGNFQVTRAAVPLLKKSRAQGGEPAIVFTASIVGLRPGPQPLPYSASKAAIVSMTKMLAWNLGPDIRVNAVAPGWMEGEWMERMLGDKYDRRRRRNHALPADGQPLRDRRDRRDRRWFHGLDLNGRSPCSTASSLSRLTSRSATATGATGATSRWRRNSPPCSRPSVRAPR